MAHGKWNMENRSRIRHTDYDTWNTEHAIARECSFSLYSQATFPIVLLEEQLEKRHYGPTHIRHMLPILTLCLSDRVAE